MVGRFVVASAATWIAARDSTPVKCFKGFRKGFRDDGAVLENTSAERRKDVSTDNAFIKPRTVECLELRQCIVIDGSSVCIWCSRDASPQSGRGKNSGKDEYTHWPC
jgi:hypothetical protein